MLPLIHFVSSAYATPLTRAGPRVPQHRSREEGIVEDQPVQRRLDTALRQPALELELVGEAVTGDCPRLRRRNMFLWSSMYPSGTFSLRIESSMLSHETESNQARVQEASGQLQGHLLQGDRSQVPEADRFSHQREQQLPAPVYGLLFRGQVPHDAKND
eukprot:tig00020616_g12248.t1